MDIKIPLPAASLAITQGNNISSALQLNQQLDVKVIQTNPNQNILTLQLANKFIQVQANQAVNVKQGQTLNIQVIKLQPFLEFSVIDLPEQSKSTKTSSETTPSKINTIILQQILPQSEKSIKTQSLTVLNQLVNGQRLTVRILEMTDKNLTGLIVSPRQPDDLKTPAKPIITLLIGQISNLSNTPSDKSTKLSAIKMPQFITLEVIKSGNQPQFKIVDNKPTAVIEQQLVETFRRLLPIQESPVVLVSQLLTSISVLKKNTTVPEALKRLALEILQNLPQKSQLTNATTLKQHILNSGQFLEAKLTQPNKPSDISLQNDFKLKLLKLIDYLKQQPAIKAEQQSQSNELNIIRDLLQKSNNSLAKIILDQLNSLPKEEGNKQIWSLELPYVNNNHAEKISIEIEQDRESDKPERKNNWSVSLSISPPNLGTIHCKLVCCDHIVNTRFWSEHPGTVTKIHNHLDYLKQQLKNNNINPGLIEVQQGKPEQRRPPTPPGQNLLHEKV